MPRNRPSPTQPRVLAVASGGGHWVQLSRLLPSLEGCDLALASVSAEYGSQLTARFYVFKDATRWNKFGLMRQAAKLLWIFLKERPDIVVSTGAAPGYLALRIGKALGARTIWVDSIANVERLSLSGQRVGPFADLWLTQWPELATSDGPLYRGSVV